MTHLELYIEEDETVETFKSKLTALGLKFNPARIGNDLEQPNFRGKTVVVLHDKWERTISGYKLKAPDDPE